MPIEIPTLATKDPRAVPGREAGLVVVQIDGLSRPALEALLAGGHMPNLARLLAEGRLAVDSWTPLLPPCTPASQAGILHGTNEGIPGFRWYEKPTQRLMVANHASDAAEIERRMSNGCGLLADDGVSIGNLLAGDAAFSHLTMATMGEARDGERPDAVHYTLDGRTWAEILAGSLRELGAELREARRQRREDVRPRVPRGWRYVIERIIANVPVRILSTELVRAELAVGRSAVYVDFTGYDEIAHHCGPGRPETIGAVAKIDASLGRIVEAMQTAPRPYELVVLSDHGQSLGATFHQRYRQSLQEVVARLMEVGTSFMEPWRSTEHDEGLARLANQLRGRRTVSALSGLLARRPGRNHHRVSRIADSRGAPLTTPTDEEIADVVVCASGNLGLIYLTMLPLGAPREAIEQRYPGLVERLAAHPGIDVVAVRSLTGPVAVGKHGSHELDRGRIRGEDPLAAFGPTAVEGLRRILGFEHAGDLVAIGAYDEATGRVVSFEELVGSHGGLGGAQGEPFIAHPPAWRIDPAGIVGAPAVHRQLRAWVARMRRAA